MNKFLIVFEILLCGIISSCNTKCSNDTIEVKGKNMKTNEPDFAQLINTIFNEDEQVLINSENILLKSKASSMLDILKNECKDESDLTSFITEESGSRIFIEAHYGEIPVKLKLISVINNSSFCFKYQEEDNTAWLFIDLKNNLFLAFQAFSCSSKISIETIGTIHFLDEFLMPQYSMKININKDYYYIKHDYANSNTDLYYTKVQLDGISEKPFDNLDLKEFKIINDAFNSSAYKLVDKGVYHNLGEFKHYPIWVDHVGAL